MNVAIFASAFYPHTGGVEELTRQLAHVYGSKGVNAIVLTNQWPPTLAEYEEYEGIPTYRLPMRAPEGSWRVHLKYHLTQPATYRRMMGILGRHGIDLLHVQCVSINGYYALLAGRALHLPLVVTAQGERTMDAQQIYARSAFMNATLHTLLTEADAITACSRDTLQDIEMFHAQPFGKRATVVYNGISLVDFVRQEPYAHPRPYILAVGRLVPQKGFDVLIQAFAASGITSHDLLLAGEGSEREALNELAQGLGLDGRVRLLGKTDRAATISLFQGCSFFVLPSRQEPQGIVNLEAMAAGKPVIASRVGGVPEIVLDGETGLLVPGEDARALAETMATLAADASLRQRLGNAGRRRAQQFTWPKIAEDYLNIYESITASSLGDV